MGSERNRGRRQKKKRRRIKKKKRGRPNYLRSSTCQKMGLNVQTSLCYGFSSSISICHQLFNFMIISTQILFYVSKSYNKKLELSLHDIYL